MLEFHIQFALHVPEIPLSVLACGALGAAQFALTGRFYWSVRRQFLAQKNSKKEPAPAVAVIVPCAGDVFALEDNVAALLRQDYSGFVEVVFVVPSPEDPAYARIRRAIPDSDRVRLCAEPDFRRARVAKLASLLHGIDRASPRAEVFVFADADLRVGADWLSELVWALEPGDASVATSAMVYAPERASLGSWLRMAWVGAGIPYLDATGCVTFQSCAIRRRDFDALGAAKLWERSLVDDLALRGLIRARGGRVRFCARAISSSGEGCGAREFLSQMNRWMLGFRVYAPDIWLLGALVTALKIALFALAARSGSLRLAATVAGLDALNLYAVFSIYRRFIPERFAACAWRRYPIAAALAAPVLTPVYALNFAVSLCARRVRWGDVTYRVRGPENVERLPH